MTSTQFAQMYIDHAPMVGRILAPRTRDQHLTEDLTAETFLRALQAAPSAEVRDTRAWLATIALNLARGHARTYRARFEAPVAEVPDAAAGDVGPEQTVIVRETVRELRRAVGLLPPRQREVIRLRFAGGLSVEATAVVMGCSEGTVKSAQHRAVKRLAQELSRCAATVA